MSTTRINLELTEEVAWFKSSYSDETGGNCVEVAHLPTRTAVRDSKHPTGPALTLPPAAWTSFVANLPR